MERKETQLETLDLWDHKNKSEVSLNGCMQIMELDGFKVYATIDLVGEIVDQNDEETYNAWLTEINAKLDYAFRTNMECSLIRLDSGQGILPFRNKAGETCACVVNEERLAELEDMMPDNEDAE